MHWPSLLTFLKPRFSYSPLSDDEIRLLELRPSSSISAPLKASIRTVNIATKPVYKALSYAWGSPEKTAVILVNGARLGITANLDTALRHIRQKTSSEILWVDAVCINQSDVMERNHQVHKMQTVFASAQEVIAWVGESYDDSDDALALLHRWGEALQAVGVSKTKQLTDKVEEFRDRVKLNEFIATVDDPFPLRGFNALHSLYRRPYWRRLWVFQEFGLAQNLSIMCGFIKIDWICLFADHFFKALITEDFLYRNFRDTFLEKRFIAQCSSYYLVGNMLVDLVFWRPSISHPVSQEIGLPSSDFWELMWANSFRDCADPRDYVFATIGFSQYQRENVTVDYSRGIEETYIEHARSCILQGDLGVLYYTGIGYSPNAQSLHETGATRWPSWAPFWHGPHRVRDQVPLLFHYELYSAAIGKVLGALPRTGKNESELVLSGKIIGTVEDLLETGSGWEVAGNTRWMELLLNPRFQANYTSSVPLLQCFYRTWRADKHWQGSERLDRDDEEHGSGLEAPNGAVVYFLMEYCMAKSHHILDIDRRRYEIELENENDIPATYGLGKFFAKETKFSHEDWKQAFEVAQDIGERFRNRLSLWSQFRSFFTTSNGYMGIAPPYSKEGDMVCVLQNAHVPFLLRKVEAGYRMVGEAFVLGLMDGEIFTHREYFGEVEDITLC